MALVDLGQFKGLVDRAMTLVNGQWKVSIAALSYFLESSPDYARKFVQNVIRVTTDYREFSGIARMFKARLRSSD
ncbi:MAG: hypothetical protein ACLP9K_08640 [Nitrososphaerales archaeon]